VLGDRQPLNLGLGSPVERTNSWFSNFGQLRRNTDRYPDQRLGQIALAITLILSVKPVRWGETMDRLTHLSARPLTRVASC
jgi:hypothetical protein